MSTLGSYLIKKRKDANLTQQKVAETLFVSRQLISCWERDLSSPSVVDIVDLSHLYQFQLNDLQQIKIASSACYFYYPRR